MPRCAIEGAAKATYAAYLQANIFDRAGMAHSGIDDVYQMAPKRVPGYLLLTTDDFKKLPAAAQAIARPDTVYGFGFGVQMRRDGKNVSHSGNQAGASSLVRISPERRAALVIMTNLEDAPLGEMASAIAAAVLGPAR